MLVRQLVFAAGTSKEQRRRLKGASEAQDDRTCVGVSLAFLPRLLRVCQRRVSPAFAARKLEVKPQFVVPSLVRCPQAYGRQNDTDGTMTHNEPLTL